MSNNINNITAENERCLDGSLFAKMAQGGAAQLRANADEVNNLNVFPVPDGDTGDNMSMTIESGVAAMEKIESQSLAEVMSALSKGMLMGARGNSGVILSQFFSGMAKGFESCDKADPETVAKALEVGVKQAYRSVLTPTEGTILTVAREAVTYAVTNLTPESTIRTLFADLTEEMYASLQRTPELLTVLKEASVVDSGGAGLFYIMEGFNKVLLGEEISEATSRRQSASVAAIDFSGFTEDSEMVYGYCTEFLLQLQRSKVDPAIFDVSMITEFLKTVGDSIVAFKDGSIVKVHVHTMTPDKVLGFCRQFGEFLTIKIENMSVQHSETISDTSNAPKKAAPRKKYATVAVANGEGIESTFREIGVDVIVSGGQTNNPSTEDFIKAFEEINAEHIFVFPNNGNIIMAAKQAASIYDKADVHVVESKDLGAGYVGIASLNPEAETPDEAIAGSLEAMQYVTTGCVSNAIRDAEMNGVHIENGDHIGFVGKKIITSMKEKVDAATALVDNMFQIPEKFMVTVFSGKDATEEDNKALLANINANHPDAEVYFINGGQEIYSYIIIAE
ncbi:MAG: DAK2 domain-containing protein [Ruminococcaceae bacterium]|nr:DAK2 domain-containing protein [Oscillospiraceae bacterium]